MDKKVDTFFKEVLSSDNKDVCLLLHTGVMLYGNLVNYDSDGGYITISLISFNAIPFRGIITLSKTVLHGWGPGSLKN